MAASTISRSSFTDGPAGTVWNSAQINSAIYDKVDALFSGALTIGGAFTAEGFGTHTLSSGGTGGNILSLRNTTAGTTNYAQLQVGNDASSTASLLRMTTSTFTATGAYRQNGCTLLCDRPGGIVICASDSTGKVRFGAGSATTGSVAIGNAILGRNARVELSGAGNNIYWGHSNTEYVSSFGNYSGGGEPFWSAYCYHGSTANTLARSSASNRPTVLQVETNATWSWRTGTVGTADADFTPTTVMSLTADGALRTADGTVSAPTYAFISDTDTGWYLGSSPVSPTVSLAIGGVQTFFVANASATQMMSLAGGAMGTGAVPGPLISSGRNSSGSGATATLSLVKRNGSAEYLWFDSSSSPGQVRIGTGQPTENNTTVSDTSGTVVGSQTSCADEKTLMGRADVDDLLRRVRAVALHRFRYLRRWQGEDFVGLVTDEAPFFGLDRDETHPGGRILNEVNAIGALMGAVQALATRVEQLEAVA